MVLARTLPVVLLAASLGAACSTPEPTSTATAHTTSGATAIVSEAPPSASPPAAAAESPAAPPTDAPPTVEPAPAASAAAALAQLSTLAVKGRAPKTGYSRDLFGSAWTDAVSVEGGRNGCDTRNDILRRDLTELTFKPGSRDCAVLTGVLADPYTGTTIAFQRGAATSSEVQIDHVVALSDAWQKGAQQLDAATRQDFANDPRNLQATQGRANQQKGDGDAATWLPPNNAYRCTYVARQVEVKSAYGLWVTAAERDAIERVLLSCGPPAPAPLAPAEPSPAPAAAPETRTAPLPANPDLYYANCAAARAAGVTPLHVGEPGYRPQMDGDKDGIACE
ncbi:GmrSD restriction endonuclease domain-containing protein [Tomitella biformata]|uniref:GmrSD restriction endonuclease domain-containing protein n=1 Tax=Tomitella biformata TaxID=630403 RepID=UPI0004B63371|nr:DUF1524 domain-containing protein [Tomitella biformata]